MSKAEWGLVSVRNEAQPVRAADEGGECALAVIYGGFCPAHPAGAETAQVCLVGCDCPRQEAGCLGKAQCGHLGRDGVEGRNRQSQRIVRDGWPKHLRLQLVRSKKWKKKMFEWLF